MCMEPWLQHLRKEGYIQYIQEQVICRIGYSVRTPSRSKDFENRNRCKKGRKHRINELIE